MTFYNIYGCLVNVYCRRVHYFAKGSVGLAIVAVLASALDGWPRNSLEELLVASASNTPMQMACSFSR